MATPPEIDYQKIVGEPFDPWVVTEIKNRQTIYSSGFGGNRGVQAINYLNGRNSWIKMGSSVDVNTPRLSFDKSTGSTLAKNYVFHSLIGEDKDSKRSGVTTNNSITNNSAYGFGGTQFGIQPPPGIISFDVDHLNRGSIRKSNLVLKAYNKNQFDLIENLYLRLGFSILVEMGHSHYLNEEGAVVPMGPTLLDTDEFFNPKESGFQPVLQKIKATQYKYHGSYEAFFGKISNFSWKFDQDGHYEISIQIHSHGDVVESLKINTLPSRAIITPNNLPTVPEGDEDNEEFQEELNAFEEIDKTLNQNAIANWLYCLAKEENETTKKATFENTEVQNFAYYHEKSNQEQNLGGPNTTSKKWVTRHYVRFGHFLQYLEDNIIPHYIGKGKDTSFPMIHIDTSNAPGDNLCNSQRHPSLPLISFNPEICLINPGFNKDGTSDYLFKFGIGDIATETWLGKYLRSFNAVGGTRGRIMNIYLEFDFLINLTLDYVNSKDEGKITLYRLLSEICTAINSSLGHVTELEPTMDEERNTLVIRDQKIEPLPRPVNNTNDNSDGGVIELFGINGNQASFAQNFSFSTTISSNISSLIAIGSTANNTSISEDATAFQKWNRGLVDRYKESAQDGSTNNNIQSEFRFSCGNNVPGTLPQTAIARSGTVQPTIGERSGFDPFGIFRLLGLVGSRLRERNREQIQLKESSYIYTLMLIFGPVDGESGNRQATPAETRFRNAIDPAINYSWKNLQLNNGGKYFSEEFSYLTERAKNLYINAQIDNHNTQADSQQVANTNNIGFIPIEMVLTLDGISGIKIYNEISINGKNILPSNYTGVLNFIVMRVGHSVENNRWVTNITAIAKPTPITPLIPLETNSAPAAALLE